MGDASGSPRLPTRCPACKGAVIQRMPSPSHGAFIWFQCLFCNHIWKFRIHDPYANLNGELTGDVFIVANGGVTYKLGMVLVNAIAQDALTKHLQSKTRQGALERQKLQRAVEGLTATLRMARAEDDRLWKILQDDERNARKADAWSVAYNKTKNITAQIEDLQAQRKHLTSGEYLCEGLPSGIASAKTDVEGKFRLTIPRRGRYGVVARGSRELGKEKQTYFWFVWVTLDGQPSKRVTLSNDNMMGQGSPDSALT